MRLPLLFRSASPAAPVAAVSSQRAASGVDLRLEIAKQTLRHLAKIGVVGQADANQFYSLWSQDKNLLAKDFLESFLRHFGHGEQDLDVVAARLTSVTVGVPVCDFGEKLPPPQGHGRLHEVAEVLAVHQCKLLHVYEQGALRSMVIGTFNPVCGAVVASYIRRTANEDGVRPYCGAMRLSYSEWQEFVMKGAAGA